MEWSGGQCSGVEWSGVANARSGERRGVWREGVGRPRREAERCARVRRAAYSSLQRRFMAITCANSSVAVSPATSPPSPFFCQPPASPMHLRSGAEWRGVVRSAVEGALTLGLTAHAQLRPACTRLISSRVASQWRRTSRSAARSHRLERARRPERAAHAAHAPSVREQRATAWTRAGAACDHLGPKGCRARNAARAVRCTSSSCGVVREACGGHARAQVNGCASERLRQRRGPAWPSAGRPPASPWLPYSREAEADQDSL